MEMTKEDLKVLGLGLCVYIHKGMVNGQEYAVLYHADGTPEIGFESMELAFATARHNNYIPLSVH